MAYSVGVIGASGYTGAELLRLLEGALSEYTAKFANPYVAAERGYIDDVIEPSQTRRELVRGLQLCLRKTVERPPRKHGNIPL